MMSSQKNGQLLALTLIHPKPNRPRHNEENISSVTVHLYSDTHGRNVRKYMEKTNMHHRISAVVQPRAKFKDVVPSATERFDQDDVVVLIGGAYDIVCNAQARVQFWNLFYLSFI
uniref:Uncharacterized protein n=1 Tax=Graphocephala atropunctata TaxID=36148 RepID=A0A1B6LDL2_9HEMI